MLPFGSLAGGCLHRALKAPCHSWIAEHRSNNKNRQTARRRTTRGGDRAARHTFRYRVRVKIQVIHDGEEVSCREFDAKGTKVVLTTETKVAFIDVLETGGLHIEVDAVPDAPKLTAVPDAS